MEFYLNQLQIKKYEKSHGRFISMYEKNHYDIVISLQLIKINENK